jgi:hypothetical protein
MNVERTHPTLRSTVPILSVRSTPQLPRRGRDAPVTGLLVAGIMSGRQEFEAEDDRFGGAVLHVNVAAPWCTPGLQVVAP